MRFVALCIDKGSILLVNIALGSLNMFSWSMSPFLLIFEERSSISSRFRSCVGTVVSDSDGELDKVGLTLGFYEELLWVDCS